MKFNEGPAKITDCCYFLINLLRLNNHTEVSMTKLSAHSSILLSHSNYQIREQKEVWSGAPILLFGFESRSRSLNNIVGWARSGSRPSPPLFKLYITTLPQQGLGSTESTWPASSDSPCEWASTMS